MQSLRTIDHYPLAGSTHPQMDSCPKQVFRKGLTYRPVRWADVSQIAGRFSSVSCQIKVPNVKET